jgi:hypothetical protein
MAVINRSAVAIAPRPPLIDWSRRISHDPEIAWGEEDHSLYLLPPYEDDQQAMRVLETAYAEIFENELCSWCTDQSLWPEPRSFALFQEWFSIRFYDLIEDLSREDLLREADS